MRQVQLTWPKRPRLEKLQTGRRRVWVSKCKQYRVDHLICEYGNLPDRVIAMVWRVDLGATPCWARLSEHRTDAPAFRACEAHARKLSEAAQAVIRATRTPRKRAQRRSTCTAPLDRPTD